MTIMPLEVITNMKQEVGITSMKQYADAIELEANKYTPKERLRFYEMHKLVIGAILTPEEAKEARNYLSEKIEKLEKEIGL